MTYSIKVKTRKLNKEIYNAAIAAGISPDLANILAKRPVKHNNINSLINPKLALLEHPEKMQDMLLASKRLAKAIVNQECIGIETDYDCDGQTSHAVIYYNLTTHFNYPSLLIKSYIGHRLTDGYGLSQPIVNKILQDSPKPQVIITADNGSSDEARIAQLKLEGIDVIITDHHQIPHNNPPLSAYAWINPTRKDCSYDPYIAGCMVAWLLMVATRIELIKLNYLSHNAPKLQDSLDYVAVGTVADCVSFAKSIVNRVVVNAGLKLINQKIKPCWQAVAQLCANNMLNTEDLGFKVAPLLNSDGRLATAFSSVSFLLANNLQEANNWLEHLQQQNVTRRKIQQHITLQGIEHAKHQTSLGYYSVCILLHDSHIGVHGISASRIKDQFGRPTAFFAPKVNEPDIISGSFRGIENFSIIESLQYIATKEPDLLIAYGGHYGAGGASLKFADFDKFRILFEEATRLQLKDTLLEPVIWSDGLLTKQLINLDFLNQIKRLEPYGKDFEAPIFHVKAKIAGIKIIGDGTHVRLNLNIDNYFVPAIWFNFRDRKDSPLWFKEQDQVTCAVRLVANNFNNNINCELQVFTIQVSKN